MKTFTITDEYNNIRPDEIINIMISPHYYDYMVNSRKDIISYKILSCTKESNEIIMITEYYLFIEGYPSILNKLVTINKFKTTEHCIYNLKDKTGHITITSSGLNIIKSNFSYTLKLKAIGNNKTSQITTFKCHCKIPFLRKIIERHMTKRTKKHYSKDAYNFAFYIKNHYSKN